MKPRLPLAVIRLVSVLGAQSIAQQSVGGQPEVRRTGRVRVGGHCLADDNGQFLGLGVSYFTALWRCKHDRSRLEADLEFLSRRGFNYYRMLSMVGHNAAWSGLEIAPVSFKTREDRRVEAWPDYWRHLGELIDLAYDRDGHRGGVGMIGGWRVDDVARHSWKQG